MNTQLKCMSNFVSLANLVKERRKSQKKKGEKEMNQAGIFFCLPHKMSESNLQPCENVIV